MRMYRVDRRTHRHRRARRRFVLLISALLIAGTIYGLMHIRISPKQNIQNDPSTSTKYNPESTKKIDIDKPELTMQLPGGWKETEAWVGTKTPTYSFRSASNDAQLLDVYLSSIPDHFALNKAIVVTAQGSGLVYDVVSENCVNFTDVQKSGSTGSVLALWQGVVFYCDTANNARAVVGTISKDELNKVHVQGPTTGEHSLFITYTDNNINPDYSTLYSILSSVHFK